MPATTGAAASAQAAMNAAMLPAAQAIQAAFLAAQSAIAQAQAIVAGCSPCRTVNLVNNAAGLVQAYTVEADGCIEELTPPPPPPAAAPSGS